jgi:hypothetical protein
MRYAAGPSITVADGNSVIAAVTVTWGNLDFYWQDNSGQFHQEIVDSSGIL